MRTDRTEIYFSQAERHGTHTVVRPKRRPTRTFQREALPRHEGWACSATALTTVPPAPETVRRYRIVPKHARN